MATQKRVTPKCECHGEPKVYCADGWWRCAVKRKAIQRRYELTEKGRARQRTYVRSDKGHARNHRREQRSVWISGRRFVLPTLALKQAAATLIKRRRHEFVTRQSA